MCTYMYNFFAELYVFCNMIIDRDICRTNIFSKRFNNCSISDNFKYLYCHSMVLVWKIVGLTIYIDNQILSDRLLWISNHRSKLDGLVLQSLLYTAGNNNLAVIKNSVKYYPLIGSFSQYMESIFVVRGYESTDILIKAAEKTILSNNSILLFPEGTTMSVENKKKSDLHSIQNGLTSTKNVLIPKTVGYSIIKNYGKFNSIGNLTIQYNNPHLSNNEEHSFTDLFTKFPHDLFINVEYIYDKDMDMDINIHDIFQKKDTFLENKIIPSNYYPVNYSNPCLIFNLMLFITFYYFLWNVQFMRLSSIFVTVYSIIRVLI